MKIVLATILSVLMVGVIMPCQYVEAVVTPSASDTEKKGNEVPSNSKTHAELEQIDLKLQKTVSEIEEEQNRHTTELENMKNELQKLQSHLNNRESQTKSWVPPRVAWALDKDSK